MTEFVDRMRAQRRVLQTVNARGWREELYGLSSHAISRWIESNNVSANSEVVTLLRSASECLSFLASRSQMQVTVDYQRAAYDLGRIENDIRQALTTTAIDDRLDD